MCRSNLDTLTSAKRLAETYDGLPDNIKRFHIINALKIAGDRLGFKKAHINYLELMVSYTRETDWIGCDSYPLVWLSVEEIAKKLKVSRQQVNRTEKALVELGAIYFEDSGNYKRRGFRNNDGCVTRAFGADLRPLAMLWDKISAEVDNAKQEEIEWKSTRTEVSSLRRRIGDILREKKQLVDNISSDESLYCRITHNTPIEVLKNIYNTLKSILSKLEKLILVEIDKHVPLHSKMLHKCCQNVTHHNIHDTYSSSISKKVEEREKLPPSDSLTKQSEPLDQKRQEEKDEECTDISLHRIVKVLPPVFRHYLPSDEGVSMTDIVEACYSVLPSISVSKSLWQKLCSRLGRQQASMCIIILATRLYHGEVDKPAGFLLGMLRKLDKGELNILPSLYGLISRARGYKLTHKTRPPELDNLNDKQWQKLQKLKTELGENKSITEGV